jgi:hypothetical protein
MVRFAIAISIRRLNVTGAAQAEIVFAIPTKRFSVLSAVVFVVIGWVFKPHQTPGMGTS